MLEDFMIAVRELCKEWYKMGVVREDFQNECKNRSPYQTVGYRKTGQLKEHLACC